MNISLKPFKILVITPEPARAAQLDALSLQVTATFLKPAVMIDALSVSKPLWKNIHINSCYNTLYIIQTLTVH